MKDKGFKIAINIFVALFIIGEVADLHNYWLLLILIFPALALGYLLTEGK